MIRIDRLNFAVGSFALKDVSLHVRPGEYFVLLGPTGSGKTLLIECLCGLNRVHSGRIYIGGTDVTNLEPGSRGIGYVPQDYALFPHKTVRENIRFGLEVRRLTSRDMLGEAAPLTDKILMELVGVSHLAGRSTHKLSGGEKQRVALARALAIHPDVLVLDEPVSALDEQTRDGLCRQLKKLQRGSGTTTLHVCHNFAEMLSVADRVGIIRQGRILQVGTPQEILQRPRNTLVAQFVQAGNLLSARVQEDGQWVGLACAGDLEFRAPKPDSGSLGGQVVVMVRPENVRLDFAYPENLSPGTTVLEGSIREVVDLGPVVRVSVTCGPGVELTVSLGKKEYNERRCSVGDRVHLAVAPEDVHVMPE